MLSSKNKDNVYMHTLIENCTHSMIMSLHLFLDNTSFLKSTGNAFCILFRSSGLTYEFKWSSSGLKKKIKRNKFNIC